MPDVTYLRERAQACRKLATQVRDRETAEALDELALVYDQQVRSCAPRAHAPKPQPGR